MNEPVTLALIVGCTRPRRTADALLPWLEDRLRHEDWIKLDVVDVADLTPSWDPAPGQPGPAHEALDSADAFLVFTPEYNHSFPGVLKQMIDAHFSEWAYKPVAFVSYGASSGGLRAIEQLRLVFPELRATTVRNAVSLPSPLNDVTDAGYTPTPATESALSATLAELRWWALTLRDGRQNYQRQSTK